MVTIRCAVAAASLLLVIPAASSHASGTLQISPACGDGSQITIDWTWYEYLPTGHPEWIGWDVLRRQVGDCGAYTRLNAESFPRGEGNQSYSLTDTPPLSNRTYEYRCIPVDAEHREILDLNHFWTNERTAFITCPERSAPVVRGSLHGDAMIFVDPCQNGCYEPFYLLFSYLDEHDPQGAQELRSNVGSGVTFDLYGYAGCGSVEGCGFSVTGFERVACDAVPALPTSWGRLKVLYR